MIACSVIAIVQCHLIPPDFDPSEMFTTMFGFGGSRQRFSGGSAFSGGFGPSGHFFGFCD